MADETAPDIHSRERNIYRIGNAVLLNLPFRIHVPVVALLAGGLLVWTFLRYEAKSAQESGAVIQQAQQALASGNRLRLERAKLVAVAQQAAARAAAAIASLHAKDTTIARLATQLQADTSARDSLQTALAQRDAVITQRDAAMVALANLAVKARADSVRAENAEARINDLERNLAATLTVADCHLLGASFLPRCPSRTAMFVIGVAGGAITYAAVHH